ncbi:MAG: nicotinate-nicotinamide nucleotide adenylyltransferase [Solobacterium sp.]|nr:nicotinate-nicotinamide nucleotide adenylyltransferase [Solobacterium sp.]
MSRALVFVGAFNPVTRAHVETADYARRELGFDQVIFVPSKQDYIRHDQEKDYAFSDDLRLHLLHKTAAGRPWMKVSDYELNLDHQPRTYQTLQALKEESGQELRLLMGSDKLPELQHGWKHIPEICREFGIAVMSRNGDDTAAIIRNDPYLSSLEPWLTVVNVPAIYQHISSSRIRQALADGNPETAAEYLPEELHELIPVMQKMETEK